MAGLTYDPLAVPRNTGDVPAVDGPSVIRYVPAHPGTIYAAGWTPRLDPQSPDLICPTDEHATLAELMRRAEDERLTAEREQRDKVWAEAARAAAGKAETVTLAEVMPQPYAGEPEKHETAKPFMGRGRRRAERLWPLLVLPLVGHVLMVLAQVALLQVAIRVSGEVL
jgi:hypothetical protein